VLTALILYRLARVSAAAPMYLAWAAFFWATGMLSHYDGLLVAPAVALLIPFVRRAGWRSALRSALPAFALAIGLLAAFYLPFLLHPQFQATSIYLVERRISGPGFPYNNLADVLRRSAVYNSTYFVASMALLLFGALGLSYWKTLAGRPGRLIAVAAPLLLAAVVIVSLIRPDWLRIAGVDVAVGFFLLCLLPLLVSGGHGNRRTFSVGVVGRALAHGPVLCGFSTHPCLHFCHSRCAPGWHGGGCAPARVGA
jgi:hypothetical protein